MRFQLAGILISWAFLGTGCGGDKTIGGSDTGSSGGDGGSDDDGGSTDGTCSDDADCSGWEICEADACVDGDRNNSVDEAQSILWEDTRTGYVNPEDDVDYYTFEAEGGEYVRIGLTLAESFEASGTTIELRKSNGKVVTSADGFATGTGVTGVDAVMFAYLDEAGIYTISVEDDGSAGRDPDGETVGSSDYTYTLLLEEWSGHTDDPDDMEQPAYVIVMDSERIWNTAGVVLEDEGDVDWIQLEYETDGLTLFIDGNQDLTGSDATPRVRLLDEDGVPFSDKINIGPDEYAIAPMLDAGTYYLEISDALGGGGSNYWTFVHIISRESSYDYTLEVENNDDQFSGNDLAQEDLENGSGKAFTLGRGQGTVDDSEDEDWYAFDVPYDESWVVVCLNSTVLGSTMAPDIEVYDSERVLLDSAAGSAAGDPTANVENIEVGPGTYYLRVVPPEDVDAGPGAWYRFNLYVASFSVSSYADGGYSCPSGY
jgi:hypothetical protein